MDGFDLCPHREIGTKAWPGQTFTGADQSLARRRSRCRRSVDGETRETDCVGRGSHAEDAADSRAAWERVDAINETIDAVAAARYSHVSGLYWYTDEEEAKRVAKQQGKPLLALRLLGNLNEELSCANSRYFRILLYPDDKVRKLLHDKFILTWKSVRPVPKITIDLGDGRQVERTITGNSVHYVVLPDATVVDLFPGLYGPAPFCERLEQAHAAAVRAMGRHDAKNLLAEYRSQQIATLAKTWKADVARYEELQRQPRKVNPYTDRVGWAPQPPPGFWEAAAGFHPEYAELSKASLALIEQEAVAAENSNREPRMRKKPDAPSPDLDYAFAKGGDEWALNRFISCIEADLIADTLHNEYCGRYETLRWLNKPDSPNIPLPFPQTLDELNDFVYTAIFHYNPDDPWIGLTRLDSLTALPKDRGLKSPFRGNE